MPVDDLLRLAWQADRDGRPGTRDALLMLAIAESGPGEAVMAERCRRRLISRQPDHWLASFPTLPGPSDATDPNATLLVFYLTVLLAVAILLASVMPPSAQDTRAA